MPKHLLVGRALVRCTLSPVQVPSQRGEGPGPHGAGKVPLHAWQASWAFAWREFLPKARVWPLWTCFILKEVIGQGLLGGLEIRRTHRRKRLTNYPQSSPIIEVLTI